MINAVSSIDDARIFRDGCIRPRGPPYRVPGGGPFRYCPGAPACSRGPELGWLVLAGAPNTSLHSSNTWVHSSAGSLVYMSRTFVMVTPHRRVRGPRGPTESHGCIGTRCTPWLRPWFHLLCFNMNFARRNQRWQVVKNLTDRQIDMICNIICDHGIKFRIIFRMIMLRAIKCLFLYWELVQKLCR